MELDANYDNGNPLSSFFISSTYVCYPSDKSSIFATETRHEECATFPSSAILLLCIDPNVHFDPAIIPEALVEQIYVVMRIYIALYRIGEGCYLRMPNHCNFTL